VPIFKLTKSFDNFAHLLSASRSTKPNTTMAETEQPTLSKVDSATDNANKEVKTKRRPSSMAADCYDILDLRE
jgi:hypothetical protein